MNPFFFVFDKIRNPLFWKMLCEMENSQSSYEEIVQRRLSRLLLHTITNIPFYKHIDLTKKNVERNAIDTLQVFPIVDKTMLMEDQKLFHVRPLPKDSFRNSTGGSTGIPLQVIQDKHYRQISAAGKHLFYKWAGWKPGAKILKIWGSPRDVLQQKATIKGQVSSVLHKIKMLDAFRISIDDAKKYLREYEAYKPDILECYVDAGYTLALHIKQTGMTVKHKPKGVIVSAGTLYPEFEKTIKDVFQAPVINRYGSREAGDIACTCPEGSIHVNPFTHYVEILDDNGHRIEEGTGHVALTLLTNYTMPLIRYKIGDMATIKKHSPPCPCGRDWQSLEQINGRTGCLFRLQDGTILSYHLFSYFISNILENSCFKKFQIVQESYDLFVFKVVLKADCYDLEANGQINEARKLFQKIIGENVDFVVEVCKDIPPLPSGKYVYAISKVEGN